MNSSHTSQIIIAHRKAAKSHALLLISRNQKPDGAIQRNEREKIRDIVQDGVKRSKVVRTRCLSGPPRSPRLWQVQNDFQLKRIEQLEYGTFPIAWVTSSGSKDHQSVGKSIQRRGCRRSTKRTARSCFAPCILAEAKGPQALDAIP